MIKTLKIAIATAGYAKRMRPQTWSKPKPLVGVAGKTAIDHLLDSFHTIPANIDVEYVIIMSPGLGEQQIPVFMQEHYPHLKIHYALQEKMLGQSDAFYKARQYLTGPIITIFSDTLINTDFSFLVDESLDTVAWVKAVEDPRRFGVAEVDSAGLVTRLIEKPESTANPLALVGCYFFRDGAALISTFEEQFRLKKKFKDEYFLADAINIMLSHGARMRVEKVETWLDTGTIEATLATNRYLLEHGCANNPALPGDVRIIPPVFIHPGAKVHGSTIGPDVSVGAGCTIENSHLADSIIENDASLSGVSLAGSFIGRRARVSGPSAGEKASSLNIGDDSSIRLGS